jgi:UDP-glucose/iron transport system permease protein
LIEHLFSNQLTRGGAECAAAAMLALVVMLLALRRGVDLRKELPLAQLRGIAQIVIVGLILTAMLHGSRWLALLVLAGMVIAAASIVRKRAQRIPRGFTLALTSMSIGAGSVLAIMIALGVVPLQITLLIPVGSMIIANTMNMQSLFLDRLRSEIVAHTGEIEAALSLGATSSVAIRPYLLAAYRTSLIPSIDNIRSLGIVWIPGIMAGMVLSGAQPIYAALYQFVILTTIFSASALTCLVSSYMVGTRLFSSQEQLLLRP